MKSVSFLDLNNMLQFNSRQHTHCHDLTGRSGSLTLPWEIRLPNGIMLWFTHRCYCTQTTWWYYRLLDPVWEKVPGAVPLYRIPTFLTDTITYSGQNCLLLVCRLEGGPNQTWQKLNVCVCIGLALSWTRNPYTVVRIMEMWSKQ